MAETLQELLEGYKATILQGMLSLNGLMDPKNQKSGKVYHVGLLARLFGDPQRPALVYLRLSPVERAAVDIILREGGQVSAANLERQLVALHLVDRRSKKEQLTPLERKPDMSSPAPRAFNEVMARLLVHGLVFGRPFLDVYGQKSMLDFGMASEYLIPEIIRRRLPAPPPLPAWKMPEISQPERIREGSARVFQRDLYFYWAYLQANPVDLTAKGLIPKRILTALNDTLLVKETIGTGQGELDFNRLVFLRQTLLGLGLVEDKGGSLRAVDAPPFFGLSPVERIKRTFHEYVNGRGTNELFWIPGVQIYSSAAAPLPTPGAVSDARRAALLFFKQAMRWASLPALLDHIRDTSYEFLFKRAPRQIYDYALRTYTLDADPYNGANVLGWVFPGIKEEENGWNQVEAAFLRCLLQGPLYWMGLVSLGYTRSELKEPDAFLLTPVGAWLLGAGKQPEINLSGGRVILQPNYQVTAFDPVSDQTLMELERFAERLSGDRAIEFRLTQASVYAAQQRGWSAGRIKAYLEELTGAAVPANVQRTLEEWQSLYERIVIYPKVSLLHAASPQDLETLSANPDLHRLLSDRPADVVVRLPDSKGIPDLVHKLTRQGWLALVNRGEGKLPANSVELAPDGRLSFTVPTPDLYLHGHLARFAEPEDGGYRLTPAALQRAARNGMTAPQVVTEIKRVLRGEFPPGLEQRLRAWAGHYGEAVLEETILLKARSSETLKELLADPEIGPLIRQLDLADVQVTARVKPKDLDRLRQILEERGIPIKI